MELEFDKEMDAILRRARDNRGVLVGDDPPEKPKHIDADEVAAFVENALPAQTRTMYMTHFADCDRCRRVLSHSMLLASESNVKAVPVVAAPVAESAASWFQRLFRMPNLAMAMGALVLVFGGFLGYMVIQNRQSDSNASVAQVKEDEYQKGGPFAADESANIAAALANTNTASAASNMANAASPSGNSVANAMATPVAPIKEVLTGGRTDLSFSAGVPADTGVVADEDKPREQPRVAKAAPPPPAPITTDGLLAAEREKKEADDKLKTKDDSADSTVMSKRAEAPRGRDLPAAASKKGPGRSGPINMQSNQIQNQTYEMDVTRSIGGKTFSNRNGAWYDSAYKNQATMNFRRGTEEYQKLDGGLRGIADKVGGTVVLIWKSKAYRIQ